MTYIAIYPFTRINEKWIDCNINCRPVIEPWQDPIINGGSNSLDTRYQADFYKYIGLDIVTETVYNYPYPYVSEKTLRPIACKRLFVVVGAPGTLKLLHNKGFETFADILDESYDLISDPNERFRQLQKTIQDFILQPTKTIIELVKLKAPVLEHNFKTLKNLQAVELNELSKRI